MHILNNSAVFVAPLHEENIDFYRQARLPE